MGGGFSQRSDLIVFAIVGLRSIWVGLEITEWFPGSTWEEDQ